MIVYIMRPKAAALAAEWFPSLASAIYTMDDLPPDQGWILDLDDLPRVDGPIEDVSEEAMESLCLALAAVIMPFPIPDFAQ